MYGKTLRLSRLINPDSKRTCIVPMDHGITLGPVDGIEDYLSTLRRVAAGGVDCVILHKGLLKVVTQYPELAKVRYIMHLSASTVLAPDSNAKVLVSTVEEALKLGADGVSIHVNLGTQNETEMIKDFGKIAGACHEWGMPLLAMVYTFNKANKDVTKIAHAARLAEELGADLVKVDYPGTIEDTRKIINGVRIPVLVAGGARMDSSRKFMTMIDNALTAGAAGVAVGRNVFQSERPEIITRLISRLIHGELELSECLVQLSEYAPEFTRKVGI
ncbi:MAG: 2-amino-3,7-dideoxy-D-threo-hept-6-ulosonate synthase [Clostridia bacterium]|nr:2-amino-3,7-dideoxy-D-threo-hept-6-ulosonate synthase [Clostridia bacterium]